MPVHCLRRQDAVQKATKSPSRPELGGRRLSHSALYGLRIVETVPCEAGGTLDVSRRGSGLMA
jgi:hypothetical protein